MSTSAEITRKAKSNLAFALRVLPPDRRADMVTFYAFCRETDDLADQTDRPAAERAAALEAWKNGLTEGFPEPTPLQREVTELRNRTNIPTELLAAIIDGCATDLSPRRYQTWDELSRYIWQVACAVGLVSIRLFGCTDPASERYAEHLGRALQLTNIIRDVGEDWENGGRIYLPAEDLKRFGIDSGDLPASRNSAGFQDLMRFETARARSFYHEAEQTLPESDRSALRPARIMAAIYQNLLDRMESGGFRVFDQRYRVPKLQKLLILAKHLIAR